MTMYDKLWSCPVCASNHDSSEWNESTKQNFGYNILPIEVAYTQPDTRYTCPTCSNVSDYETLQVVTE